MHVPFSFFLHIKHLLKSCWNPNSHIHQSPKEPTIHKQQIRRNTVPNFPRESCRVPGASVLFFKTKSNIRLPGRLEIAPLAFHKSEHIFLFSHPHILTFLRPNRSKEVSLLYLRNWYLQCLSYVPIGNLFGSSSANPSFAHFHQSDDGSSLSSTWSSYTLLNCQAFSTFFASIPS